MLVIKSHACEKILTKTGEEILATTGTPLHQLSANIDRPFMQYPFSIDHPNIGKFYLLVIKSHACEEKMTKKMSPRAENRTRRTRKRGDGTKSTEGRSIISEIGLEIIEKKLEK